MTTAEKKMHTQILAAIQVIVDESEGEVSYSLYNQHEKSLFNKSISKTTVIEIKIKRSV
jgi:hypothetical protein